ncbi:S9 family peptidase [Bifidobacterium platyrrhinorum]|uniref:Prolyl oligopeptidase family serine peptidase n=1 Tax=Bifidobacterium platyrrhinorum TaxID=2661628 RepID=A0A6L9SRH4_9BIFI|nr:S9 family peptidase [Bifidobacterium platyrrhinorum]NEG55166.1 prolyl oligopeptidase family serine peptidase [Bifidobacterium platyrrhinorum]
MPPVPVADREPTRREHHGDVFVDPYEWMRDKDAPRTRDYVAAQNRLCEARNAHLEGLRHTLFDELKSHVQETDMSVPVRINDYWYFARTREGRQYAVQCRMPVRGADDWDPPQVDPFGEPGTLAGESAVFDANKESEGHDFFRLGGMDLSRDGRWMLYGVDTAGDERYDYRIRDLETGEDRPEVFAGVGGACFTPDGGYVFWVELDDAWRPCAVWRHKVGTPVGDDVCVYREEDERFWVGVGLSFDERNIVLGTGSKTTTEVLMLPVDDPEGEFRAFIPRKTDVEYDVSFACFEGAGEHGADLPLAVVYHNAKNPNFEVDVIDMSRHEPPYTLGEGVCVAEGSPYGCERGGGDNPGRAITEAYFNPANPAILQGLHGLGVEGISIHRHFVTLAYRADGLQHVAVMPKALAAEDFLAGRPWRFTELLPPALENDWDMVADDRDLTGDHGETLWASDWDAGHMGVTDHTSSSDGASDDHLPGETRRLYSIGTGGNPSYDAPRMRYSFTSYTRPGELHEIDPSTGEDRLLKRATVLGGFDPRDYMERRVWIKARDGERIPVSLVWHRDFPAQDSPMFITGYGAYEISSDPNFSVARLSMLDRGVLYAVPHIRGGGELGRAWYEQGRRLNKKHSFEDFVDATIALQRAHLADPRRTVANGGSAGGLLMGAVANLAPDRYAGIEADVPFVDALTSILDPSLPLTVTEWDEWGDPLHDEDVYRYMKSYTPYENLPDAGTRFPRIFITTSMNDTRVLYVEPLKWLAAMQSRGFDAIAKIEVEAGHGGISGRYKQWEEVSYENAWCLDVMGLTR